MSTINSKPPLYFIAMYPPSHIRKEIEVIKKDLKDRFRTKHALKLPAHITLQIPFRMPVNKEKILLNKLERFLKEHPAFHTDLEGFGRFAKNVIFIKVVDHEPYIHLYEELQQFMLDFLDLKSHEISSKIHPHITLATRDLKRSHFPKIWEYFQDREYSNSFLAEKIQVLKHNGQNWDILKSLSLATRNK
ncbi:MAG: 2'-5' RNA ligase family protein [Gramella sp.]|nr:2'-5' RNA ligase family protein [Christiangramia sp.]